jgi:ssDNA-binding replication factor A large subunit
MLYQVKDLRKDTKRVNIVLKLITRLEPRYAKGHKITIFLAADATGAILIPLWNDDGSLVKVGDVIEVQNGYVSEFREKLQLNVGKFGNFKKVESPEPFAVNPNTPVEVEPPAPEDENPIVLEEFCGQKKWYATLRLFIQAQVQERTVHTKQDGEEHHVVTFLVGDASGCIWLNAWDAQVDSLTLGTTVLITHAYTRTFQKRRYLALAKSSQIIACTKTTKINCQHDFSDLSGSVQGG